MQVTVVRPTELGSSEARLWSTFQQSSQLTTSPYLSLTFAQAVDRVRSNARVAVVEVDNKIVAFLPFDQGRRGIAQPIGYPVNELQGFISSLSWLDARSVVRKAGLRCWHFQHAPADQEILRPYHYNNTIVSASVINLSDGYDDYTSGRSGSFKRKLAKQRRDLERSVGPISFQLHANHNEYFHKLIDWRTRKYHRARRLFSEDPSALRVVEEIARTNYDDCRNITSVLSAGDYPIAIVSFLLAAQTLTGWLISYDHDFRRYSPGLLLLLSTAEESAKRSVSRIDLGYGNEPYKARLANEHYKVATGVIWGYRAEHTVRKAYRTLYYDRHHQAAGP